MDGATFREYTTEAIRYWEPRRIVYNLVLAAIVGICFFTSGFYKRPFSLDEFLLFVLLCVLANVAYCAAYVVDIFAQTSGFREQWRNLRWVLFAIGLVFAAILTRFWSMGLFSIQ
jgi:hypothetical protein